MGSVGEGWKHSITIEWRAWIRAPKKFEDQKMDGEVGGVIFVAPASCKSDSAIEKIGTRGTNFTGQTETDGKNWWRRCHFVLTGNHSNKQAWCSFLHGSQERNQNDPGAQNGWEPGKCGVRGKLARRARCWCQEEDLTGATAAIWPSFPRGSLNWRGDGGRRRWARPAGASNNGPGHITCAWSRRY